MTGGRAALSVFTCCGWDSMFPFREPTHLSKESCTVARGRPLAKSRQQIHTIESRIRHRQGRKM